MTRATALAGGVLVVLFAAAGDARATAALASIAARGAKAVASAGLPSLPCLVVSAPLTSDVPAPRGEELAERLAQVVAGALGGAARAAPHATTLAQARVLAGKEGARLVYAQPVIAKGVLRVTFDAYAAASNGWDRVRNPEPAPSAHAFAEGPIDAEVRAYLATIPLEHASVHRATHEEGDVLAAACGDLDGDGGMDLVLVSRARVAAGHIRGGRFVPAKTSLWSALAPRVPVPLREPLAGAVIVRPWESGKVGEGEGADAARLLVGTTDRGGVSLDSSLVLVGNLRGIPQAALDDACAAPVPEASTFGGAVTGCGQGAAAGMVVRSSLVPASFDAVAIAELVRPDGTTRTAQAAREPGGKLDLRWGDATQTIDGVGAQIALGDLDQDGVPEIATSAAVGDDAITVASWDGASDPRPRLRLDAPGGVRALCICPPEERGTPALVAVVGNEVWIVR